MYETTGDYPEYAEYIKDPINSPEDKTPFKCRIENLEGEYYTMPIDGLADTGAGAIISTKQKLEYKKGAVVILHGNRRSVQGIRPILKEPSVKSVRNKKRLIEYYITLV